MSTTPIIVTVRGIPNSPSTTEFNVRSGPGTSFDRPFKARVGTKLVALLEVRADANKAKLNNKVYQWFRVTFPDGREGWMRDDLLEVQGDCSAFGYGVIATPTFAFTLVRDETVPAPKPQPPPEPTPEPPLVTPPTNELPVPTDPAAAAPANQTAAAAPADPCQWWFYDWSSLSDGARQALGRLGWTEVNWRSPEPATWPATAGSTWDGLRSREQRAAEQLGYTQAIWDSCGLP